MDRYKETEPNSSKDPIGFNLKTEHDDVLYNLVRKKEQDSPVSIGVEVPLGGVCGVKQETFDPTIVKKLVSDVKIKTEVPLLGVGDMKKGLMVLTPVEKLVSDVKLKTEVPLLGVDDMKKGPLDHNTVEVEEATHNCEGALWTTTSSNQQRAVGPCAYNVLSVEYTSVRGNTNAKTRDKQYRKETEPNHSKDPIGFILKTERDDVLYNLVRKKKLVSDVKFKTEVPLLGVGDMKKGPLDQTSVEVAAATNICEGATWTTTSCNQQPAVGPCAYNVLNVDYTSDRGNTNAKISGKQSRKGDIKDMFICSHCTYKAKRKNSLVVHMRTHTNERPFPCNQCGYRSAHRGALVNHMNIHTNEKPFACSQCAYRTAHRRALVNHMTIHTNEKTFACSQCAYRSARREAFVKHIKIHTNEKRFACSECAFSTKQRCYLVTHIKTHTNEKHFACSKCAYRTKYRRNLIIHIITHTNEKPFACSQ